MKSTRLMLLAGIAAFSLFATSSAFADGKSIFVSNKCDACHSVKSAGITSKKSNATDLSKVGATQKADTLAKYLQKKAQINGKNHMKAWSGSAADLTELTKWLGGLK